MNTTINNNILGGITMSRIATMKDFAQVVKEAVEEALGAAYEVRINEVLKNNSQHLTGLTIGVKGSNIAPTVYLDSAFDRYQDGDASVETVVAEVLDVYQTHREPMPFDVSFVTDYRACKDQICIKLVNADLNEELLADAPHKIVCEDLAVVFYVLLSNDRFGSATITIRNGMFESWHVTVDELFETALMNTQRLLRGSVTNLASVMLDLMSDRLDEEDAREFYDMCVTGADQIPLFVCTNETKMQGAAVLLYPGLLKDFAERTGSDFYILPSSIHETLLVPVNDQTEVENLRDMVRSVNETEVAPADRLSDNVYIYKRETDQITLA